MRPKLVAGNWKMHGSVEESGQLLHDLSQAVSPDWRVDVAVFPPAIYLGLADALLEETPIAWGAQNFYVGESGAFTGEISAPMLVDVGCRYVLVGHSERRALFGESDALLVEKVRSAIHHGLTPIYCVGENEDQYRAGEGHAVVLQQLEALCEDDEVMRLLGNLVIAYEPVWAIGTGLAASGEHAQAMHAMIRVRIEKLTVEIASEMRILYGGSVKSDNVSGFVEQDDVDGVLVGGASLKATEFIKIVERCNQYF